MGSQVEVFGASCLFSRSSQHVQVRFSGVNHLAMATGDMDKTIHFWRDLLGMRLVAGLGQPGYRHYFSEFSKTDLLAFFEWLGVEPVQEKDHGQPVSGPFIFDHVSFGVETEEDLWRARASRLSLPSVSQSIPVASVSIVMYGFFSTFLLFGIFNPSTK